MNNDQPLLRKQGDDRVLLRKKEYWIFTSTESKNSNDDKSYCCSNEKGIDHLSWLMSYMSCHACPIQKHNDTHTHTVEQVHPSNVRSK